MEFFNTLHSLTTLEANGIHTICSLYLKTLHFIQIYLIKHGSVVISSKAILEYNAYHKMLPLHKATGAKCKQYTEKVM